MRSLRQWVVVLGALALAAAGAGTAGAGTAGARAAGARAAGGERIPSSVHALEVSVRRPNRPPTSDVSVTSAAQMHRIAALIDDLQMQGPGALDCTGKADDPVVTFTFRSAARGRVLALATQIIEPGTKHGSCEPMTLIVKGRPRTPLLGGTSAVRAAQRLLGIRLPRP